jgi:outer membrane protein TolC
MELRQRDINIQNALNDLVVAAAENEFKASIDVSFGLTGTNKSFSDIYTSPNTDKLFAVSLNIPLFDWGKRKHHIAASNARVEIRRLSAREEKKQIEYEIRQAYRDLQNQKTQIEIAEKNIVNAQLTYEINLELYKSGDLSSKDLQFYQLQLSAQQLGEVEALINYKVALLELKIRTLWDFEKNVSIIGIK